MDKETKIELLKIVAMAVILILLIIGIEEDTETTEEDTEATEENSETTENETISTENTETE